ncbi:MAG: cysteine hydrolase [Thermoprotei archaeon]|nr:MAG: cysteine hydrolase [Thermoprotei archaeon]RLF24232.1 MAG: cysteine hydrolase [Thermoprotei archaeon]
MGRVAVLVIDMLKDFVTGALKCERAKDIIPNISKILEAARAHKIPVIYTNDSHLPDIDAEFRLWGPHAIKGTDGAEVVDELKPKSGDYIVEKRRYSAFFQTDLDILLRELKVDTLILTGIHSTVCVLHTAADAFFRGYRVIVVEDATTTFTVEEHKRALDYMKNIYGAEIMKTDEIITRIKEGRV